jgi:CBS domain-containing protein
MEASTPIGELLGKVPPFSFLSTFELISLTKTMEIQFFEEKEVLFQENTTPKNHFFFIQKGSVELLFEREGHQEISEICDEGEIIGIKAILGNRNYLNTARAHEDTLVLVIPYSSFLPHLEKNSKISLYFAVGFSAGMSIKKTNLKEFESARKELSNVKSSKSIEITKDSFTIDSEKKIIHCQKDTTIQNAAEIMSEYKVGSIFVLNQEGYPQGILTDLDLRTKVVSKAYPIDRKVSEIMSSPVRTVSRDISLSSAILLMMNQNIRHLCVTEDGTPQSKAIGIITEHDVLLAQGESPAILTKEILQSKSIFQLPPLRNKMESIIHQYVRQDVSIPFILDVITEVNDALISKIIELSVLKLKELSFEDPGVDFVWLSLGSEGRREQSTRTDQDNALLYEDPLPEKKESVKSYFLQLGKLVTEALHDCGFAYCPGNIMASNPNLCMSQSEWRESFYRWILSGTPEAVLNLSIFFDFRAGHGKKELAIDLEEFIQSKIPENKNILRFLGLNSVSSSPPLGIFRNFLVERQGKHKNEFDIKLRGITPLVDAARVLSLENKIHERSTLGRFEELGKIFPKLEKEYEEAKSTFEILTRFRLKNQMENPGRTNHLNPDTLTKMEKEILKYGFKTIHELQSRLRVHFQLHLISV